MRNIQIIIMTVFLLSCSYSLGQDFGDTEKFGKAFLKAVQNEKKDKKIISSPKVFQGIFDEMLNSLTSGKTEDQAFAEEFAEQMKKFDVDSLQQELQGKIKSSMSGIRSTLKEKGIALKSLEFSYVDIELEDMYPFNLISGTIAIYAKDDENDVIITTHNCIYFQDTWYTGDNMDVRAGKYIKYCKCLEPKNENDPVCVDLKNNFESVYEAMNDEEKERFQNEIASCMELDSYDEKAEEAAEEAYEEEGYEYEEEGNGEEYGYEEEAVEAIEDYDDDGYPEEETPITPEELKKMKALLEKKYPDYCECHERHNEEAWKEKCEKYGLEIMEMYEASEDYHEQSVILKAMSCED